MAIPAELGAKAFADMIEAAGLGGFRHGDGPHGLSDGADPLEPCVAREIVGPRQSHRRRQCKPRAQLDLGAGCNTGRKFVLIDRDPDIRWERGIVGADEQPDGAARGEMVDRLDPARDIRHERPVQPWLRDPFRTGPDQAATDQRRERKPAQSAATSSLPQREADQREGRTETQE